MGEVRELELLVLVKSYPLPSQSLGEAVCVIGLSKELGFVRIYPVPFRRLEDDKQFRKYEVIRLRVKEPRNDPRPNTFRPELDSIEVIESKLSSADKWRARKDWIIPFRSDSMCGIQQERDRSNVSMGFFRPQEVLDITQEEADPNWSPRDLAKLSQEDLFMTREKKLLEKIPYNWKYKYKCEAPGCGGHTQTIIDWEINAFYLKNIKGQGITDPAEVHDMIKEKFLVELCGSDKDTHFFTGNMLKHPSTFLILGVFWPPIERQMTLI